jgi:hypothetical protein
LGDSLLWQILEIAKVLMQTSVCTDLASGAIITQKEITKVNSTHFLAIYSMVKVTYAYILTKNGWLGYILGDFFTNSSGHPGRERGPGT